MAKVSPKVSTAAKPAKKNPAESYGKHPGGAPRTVTPPKDELQKLGEDMVEWFLNNAEADHFTEYYSIHKGILRKDWNSLREKPEFTPYYEKCRNIILKRLKAGSVKEGIAHRYLSLVDTELRDHERSIKIEDAEIKAKENMPFSEADVDKFKLMMSQLHKLQS